MAKKVFYSFHYKNDNWRVSQIRNIGAIEGNKPANGNDWEEIAKSETKIKKWIDDQLVGRSTVIVLIGKETAGRKWINYEIETAYKEEKAMFGIYIHGLKDINGDTTLKGANPFDELSITDKDGKEILLSKLFEVYTPSGSTSTEKYNDIAKNIEGWIDDAMENKPY